MVAHGCNPSTEGADSRGFRVQSQPGYIPRPLTTNQPISKTLLVMGPERWSLNVLVRFSREVPGDFSICGCLAGKVSIWLDQKYLNIFQLLYQKTSTKVMGR